MVSGVPAVASAILLLIVVAIAMARRPAGAVNLYAWLAPAQAALLVVLALRTGSGLLWVDAALFLFIKSWWVPSLLRRYLRGSPSEYGLQVTAAPALLFFGAAALTVLCIRFGLLLMPSEGLALGLCFAATLLGLGVPIVRTELWCQVPGILAGEAGLAGFVLLLVGDIPFAEALMLAEVVLLALVLGMMARLVHRLHGASDARLLEALRG